MFKQKRKPSIISLDLLIPVGSSGCRTFEPQAARLQLEFCVFMLLHEWKWCTRTSELLQLKLCSEQLRGGKKEWKSIQEPHNHFFPLHPRGNHGCTSKSAACCFVQMASLYPWRRSEKGSSGDTCRCSEDPVVESLKAGNPEPSQKHSRQLPSLSNSSFRRWKYKSSLVRNNPQKRRKRWNRPRKVKMT